MSKPKRYHLHGTRLSVHLLRYDPVRRQYQRTGQTRRTAVETEREAAAFWRWLEQAVRAWENRP